MRTALVADVHGNLPALEAVLEAIEAARPDRVVCLGDLVGYNAEPAACVALVRARAQVVVAGNHDRELGRAASPGTSSAARAAIDWTRGQLDAGDLAWLAALPSHAVLPDLVAAHGSWLSEIYVSGYVTSTMLGENLRAVAARPGWPRLACSGHTHAPMLGWWDGAVCHESALAAPERWPAAARAVLVNPGAVGQPRDGDPRASFALVDHERRHVEVRRVTYDVARACRAIAAAGLPAELGERLRLGR